VNIVYELEMKTLLFINPTSISLVFLIPCR
jgi:hypothetical protein